MLREIVAINLRQRIAVADDGTICTITNLLDDAGEETDVIEEAVVAVVRVFEWAWLAIRVSDYERVRVQ